VTKYMVRLRKPPSQTWRTFLENHVSQLVSVDFFTVPTIWKWKTAPSTYLPKQLDVTKWKFRLTRTGVEKTMLACFGVKGKFQLTTNLLFDEIENSRVCDCSGCLCDFRL